MQRPEQRKWAKPVARGHAGLPFYKAVLLVCPTTIPLLGDCGGSDATKVGDGLASTDRRASALVSKRSDKSINAFHLFFV